MNSYQYLIYLYFKFNFQINIYEQNLNIYIIPEEHYSSKNIIFPGSRAPEEKPEYCGEMCQGNMPDFKI